MKKRLRNKVKNKVLSAIFAACVVLMVSGCYTAVAHPIRTLVVELGCMAWLITFGYANGFFDWEV